LAVPQSARYWARLPVTALRAAVTGPKVRSLVRRLGALAGLGVEKSMKKCEKYLPSDNGYGSGYGPLMAPIPMAIITAPAPMVTYSMVPVTTTTVTEEIYYETVPAKRKARAQVEAPKPKRKPRCTCR
jgi:hypothetical protein